MQLANARQRRDWLNVEIIERVARVEAHAERTHGVPGAANRMELGYHRRAFCVASFRMEGVRVGAGVDLADLRADHGGCLDLSDVGVDEDRRDDARRREWRHDR